MQKTNPTVLWASVLGTTIEWYDFLIYAVAAALVFNKLFFPTEEPIVGTIAALGTSAAGFLARPLGGALIGRFGDRIGRKKMLVISMLLMGGGTFCIGCLPTWETIGVWAPISLVVLRCIQGIGMGGEWPGAVIMVAEHSSKWRGFFGSLVQIGFPLGIIASSGVFALLTYTLSEQELLRWGWRIPFLASALLVWVGIFVRVRLAESPAFMQAMDARRLSSSPLSEVLRKDWRTVLLSIGITVSEVGVAYLLTTFMLAYAKEAHVPRETMLWGIACAALAECIVLPIAGWLSDLCGRKTLYVVGTISSAYLFGFEFFPHIDTKDPITITWTLVITMALAHGLLFGPKAAFIPELFRMRVRYSGTTLGANVAAALSGGLSPIIAMELLSWNIGTLPISVYIVTLSLVSLAAVLFTQETRRTNITE